MGLLDTPQQMLARGLLGDIENAQITGNPSQPSLVDGLLGKYIDWQRNRNFGAELSSMFSDPMAVLNFAGTTGSVPLTKYARAGSMVDYGLNPSPGEIARVLNRYGRDPQNFINGDRPPTDSVRGVVDARSGDTYIWPAAAATHAEMIPALKEGAGWTPAPLDLKAGPSFKTFELRQDDGGWRMIQDPMSRGADQFDAVKRLLAK